MSNHNLVKFLVYGMMLEDARLNGFDVNSEHYRYYIESTLSKCAVLASNPVGARLPDASFSDFQVAVWEKVREVMINHMTHTHTH